MLGFFPASDTEVAAFRTQHGLEHPYFLVVGERLGVDGYKNASLVFRAFRDWPAAGDNEIVCVGGRPQLEPELRAAGPRVRARRLSLSDEELRLAYAGAEALVFPSRYEGFGLPVIEAMACGCPVITTPVSSLPEVAGDAALYVDPDDAASLRQALDAVRDPERRAAMIAAGEIRAEALTWDAAAAAFASVLTAAAQTAGSERALGARRCLGTAPARTGARGGHVERRTATTGTGRRARRASARSPSGSRRLRSSIFRRGPRLVCAR